MVVGCHGSVWKKSIFFRWKISWLSATVVCGLLQYGAWLSRVAAAAAAWESPWSELQIFRSLLFVFFATLKLTLIVRFFSPSWPAGLPPILSVWFWSVGRVVGRLGWKLLLLLLLSGSELGAWFIHVQLQPTNCPTTKTRSVMLLLWEWKISHSQMILICPFFQVADLSYWNSIDNSRRITRKQEKLKACSFNILFTISWANAVSSFANWHLRQKEEEGTLKTAWQHSNSLATSEKWWYHPTPWTCQDHRGGGGKDGGEGDEDRAGDRGGRSHHLTSGQEIHPVLITFYKTTPV